mgnify:CR=1 FL=1
MTVIGSRGSDLALWQARHVRDLLAECAGLAADIRVIQTAGDRLQDAQLTTLEGKGFFTKEIEEALLGGEIDLAVHSHKDLPTQAPLGLVVAAVPQRGPVEECLVARPQAWDDAAPGVPLREGALVGTGSPRRASQLLALRSDLRTADLRGNVPTRVGKVAQGRYDAILLARAGLVRLGLEVAPLRLHVFDPDVFVPAPAQGALAVQLRAEESRRAGDEALAQAVARIHHLPSARAVAAERLLLAALEGGCNLPLGAHAVVLGDGIRLTATLGLPGGGVRRCVVEADDPASAARAARRALTA